MEALRTVEAGGLEITVAEQQIGRRRTVEAEAALPLCIESDERQRGLGGIGADDVVGTDTVLGQAFGQEVAEHVAAQHADELRLRAQPRGSHRDVGRCPAGVLQERARRVRIGRRLRQ